MTRRPAVVLFLAFVLGLCAHNIFGAVPLMFILIGALAVTLVGTRIKSKRCARMRYMFPVLIFTILCGAFSAWNCTLIPAEHISVRLEKLKGRDVEVVGEIVGLPELKSRGFAPKQIFVLDLTHVDGHVSKGRLIVNLFGPGHFSAGDKVRLVGKMTSPFDPSRDGKGSYTAYLARQGIFAVLHVRTSSPRQWIESHHGWSLKSSALFVRLRLQAIFDRFLSLGEAGLMKAMLLGPRDDIAPHVYDIFRKTGTAHIIAISGMNMTLTALGVVFFLGLLRIGRLPRAILAAVILGFYSLMAGNSAPVARSALMAGLVILSFVIERETDPFNTLALAALVLLAVDPHQLEDIGFQLSFVCVASLLVITPLILLPFEEMGLRQKPVVWFFIESAGVTLAAFIGSAGILAYDFGYVAPVGLIVNLPVIPLMALVTALGALVLLAGITAPFAAAPFALCLKVVLNASVWVLDMASRVPVVGYGHMAAWWVAGYYLTLTGLLVWSYGYQGRGGVWERVSFIDKHLPV